MKNGLNSREFFAQKLLFKRDVFFVKTNRIIQLQFKLHSEK